MSNVDSPIGFTLHYDTHPSLPLTAEEVIATTPVWHDILIQNVVSTGTPANKNEKRGYPIYIYGRAESPIKGITFDNVNISAQKGVFFAYCDVKFINNCVINGRGITDVDIFNKSTLVKQTIHETNITVDNTTGINGVSDVQPLSPALNRTFTLNGSEVQSATAPGIYVKGGKKFIVK